MSITNFMAAIIIMLASIVYEFTVISRFIVEQRLKQQLQDERARKYPAP
jgi:hypothetical protein